MILERISDDDPEPSGSPYLTPIQINEHWQERFDAPELPNREPVRSETIEKIISCVNQLTALENGDTKAFLYHATRTINHPALGKYVVGRRGLFDGRNHIAANFYETIKDKDVIKIDAYPADTMASSGIEGFYSVDRTEDGLYEMKRSEFVSPDTQEVTVHIPDADEPYIERFATVDEVTATALYGVLRVLREQ